ncbi:uncharacterized protein HD556DRAFT_1441770 [Suillus plorans]|uniref:Uncharacterized protein n=1 Tax=Suillus plorans TaxID=116603 RepID=A0A9P7ASX0_9AGAM|nr:uncharacterized protein HD556DRAFT_1441770 [Suillus plorans]KAG1795941.1 hypothetical protein HD556DRAFT_1441770 [Suillus plorans]
MPEWTCTACATVLCFEEVNHKKVVGKHCKTCMHRQKTAGTWPVPAVAGTFCCPFRYRGCRFSNVIDRVRKHYAKSVECPGPGTGDTPMSIYGPATSLSSQELGKFVEASYPMGLTPIALPNSSSVVDNGPLIKDHPRLLETMDYHPPGDAPIATPLSSALLPTKPNTPNVLVVERVFTDQAAPSISSPAPLKPLDSSAFLDSNQGDHVPVRGIAPLDDPIPVAIQKVDNKRKETASSSQTQGLTPIALPNSSSVVDNGPPIKDHLHFLETMDCRPPAGDAPIATPLSSALPPTKPNTPNVLVVERVFTDQAAPSISSPAPLMPLDGSAFLDSSQGDHVPVWDIAPLDDPIPVVIQKVDNKRKETASSSQTDGKGVQKRIKLNATPMHRVHCPRCNVYVDGNSTSLRAHFKEKKEKGGPNQWHIYSFSFTPAWGNRNIRIYREEDLRFVCACGKFSDYNQDAIEEHLSSLDHANTTVVDGHGKDRSKPCWTRA